MRAQVIKQFGGPDVFEPMEVKRPTVLPGHVLIRVAATSVNPIDIKIRSGMVPHLAPPFPAILHGDVSGIVEEVGEGVTQFQVGDEVFGCAGLQPHGGALADYLLADASLLSHKPKTLSFREAAALPLVSITAWEAVFDRARIEEGQNVLIHAGAGGVGHIAVQLAKIKGANVFTTVSPGKMELAAKLGADTVINYQEMSVSEYVDQYTNGEGFDVVIDTVGGENIDRSFEAAKINGTVVTIAARSTHDLTIMHNKGLTLHAVFMILPLLTKKGYERHGQINKQIAQWVDEDRIQLLTDPQIFTFSEVAKAHAHLESGKAIGKVTLVNENFQAT